MRNSVPFYIQNRLSGYVKYYARELIYDIARKHRVKGRIETRPVPHMSLYGGSETYRMKDVIQGVVDVGKRYRLVPFTIRGFDYFDKASKVIFIRVDPSDDLVRLRKDLYERLRLISKPSTWDKRDGFNFHITIAFKDIDEKFDRIWDDIKLHSNEIQQHLFRITILGTHNKIMYEYDLILQKLLNRNQALSPKWRDKTVNEFRKLIGINEDFPAKVKSLSKAIKHTFLKKSIFFIGDTHFDHTNIIRYCKRPFSCIGDMNRQLVKNWNQTVDEQDTVYHLGDWAFGSAHRPAVYWTKRVHGHITPIIGGHDSRRYDIGYKDSVHLNSGKYKFLLIHDPADKPADWDGWIIHGHVHNNNMRKYPFINGREKTINVSADLINYCPVSLSTLLALEIDSIIRMDTIDSSPERL